jgi:RNA polymerase sigma-70 factor (ECF subfamily)
VAEPTNPPTRSRAPTGRTRPDKPWDSDAELVQHILGGSTEHFEMLYAAYFPRVYRFALKRLRDPGEAEDVTQEVFFTVFDALHSFKGESSLLVWIFGITRNTVNRRFRRARPRLDSLDGNEAHQVIAPDVSTDRAVDARRMLSRCAELIEHELTPLQRRIFHLKHLRRQSIRTIAAALGKSEDAIKANLYRVRRAIADAVPGLDTLLGT